MCWTREEDDSDSDSDETSSSSSDDDDDGKHDRGNRNDLRENGPLDVETVQQITFTFARQSTTKNDYAGLDVVREDDNDDTDADDDERHDDDDDQGDQCTCLDARLVYKQHTNHCVTANVIAAVEAAIRCGHVDMLRYMTTTMRLGECGPINVNTEIRGMSLMRLAASSGHSGVIAHLHDRGASVPPYYARNGQALCRCSCDIAKAAWEAPTLDAVHWMRDNGCAGYAAPTLGTLCFMIAKGRLADATEVFDTLERPIRLDHRIADAVALASGRGHTDTIEFAIQHGLCNDALPILIGAATAGRTDMIDWAVDPANALVSALATPPNAIGVDTVVAAAITAHQADVVTWIAHRLGRPRPSLMWVALNYGAAQAARALDAVLDIPFDWSRAVGAILCSRSLTLLRYAVEEKGVAIEPWAVCAAVDGHLPEEMISYLTRCIAADRMQGLVDMLGARAGASPARAAMAMVCEIARDPLCLSVAQAVDSIAHKRAPGQAERCGCGTCKAAPVCASASRTFACSQPRSPAKRSFGASRATDDVDRCAADGGSCADDVDGRHTAQGKRARGDTTPSAASS
nr:hypothetical protein [Pandoravirus belohorizontensis]